MRWFLYAVLGFFSLCFAAGLALVWHLSPIMDFEPEGQLKVGDVVIHDAFGDSPTSSVSGEQNLKGKAINLVRIPFQTAKLDVQPSHDAHLRWSCKMTGGSAPSLDTAAGVLTLHLDVAKYVKCTISLPSGSRSEFQGVNGKMDVKSPSDMRIDLNNGRVEITPDPELDYNFDVKVKNGLQDFFPRSNKKTAVHVKVDVKNGMVKKE